MPAPARLARPEEHEEIWLLGYDTWGQGASVDEYIEECRGSSKYAGGRWWVLVEKGRIASALMTTALGPATAGIGSVATTPALRRRGLAATLLRDVLERLVGEGISTVFLHSDVDPHIYASVGFAPVSSRFQHREGSVLMAWGPGADALVSSPGFEPPAYF